MKKSRILLLALVLIVVSLVASSVLVRETVEVSRSLSVSSFGNISAISTSKLEAWVEVDRLDLATAGWSYGTVVFSDDPRHSQGSRVLVAKNNLGGYLMAGEVVFPTHLATVNSFDNSIPTSVTPINGLVIVVVDNVSIEASAWSYGSVVFSDDPLYTQGSRVLVAKNNLGGHSLVYEESISTILAFIKTGLEVAELVYGDLGVPLGQ